MAPAPSEIAMILPLTQASGASVVGASLRNAAQLAYAESGANDVMILVKDDRSTPAGAGAATQAAIDEGAEIILGPLFAAGVREAGHIARGAGRPMVAYSTDTSTAARGTYLLSFLVDGYVERIIDFAAQRGKKSIAALIPENDYGTLALAQFQQSAANHGLRVLTIERYKPGAAGESIRRIAAARDQIDSLFIPEQAEAMGAVSRELASAGLEFEEGANPRHRPVERSARARPSGLAGRLVLRARKHRLQRLRPEVSRQIRRRSGAHRDARL